MLMKACLRSLILAAAALLAACATPMASGGRAPRLADPDATRETRALFVNLQRL